MADLWDFVVWWAFSLIAGATVAIGQIAHKMAKLDLEMPADPSLQDAWRKRKRWLAITEVLALPAFATLANSLRVYFEAHPIVGVLLTMLLGFVGFAMLIDGAKHLFKSRTGMPAGDGT